MLKKTRHNDRRCVASRQDLPPGALALRFVRDPDGRLLVDLSEKLPGRGAWLSADRQALLDAIAQGAFARSFKAPAPLPNDRSVEGYADDIADALLLRAVNGLGLARKAGCLVAGFDKVRERVKTLRAYVTPVDAAADGVRKITSRLEANQKVPHIQLSLSGEALGRALGDPGVVHIGVLMGKGSEKTLYDLSRWQAFVGDAITPPRNP